MEIRQVFQGWGIPDGTGGGTEGTVGGSGSGCAVGVEEAGGTEIGIASVGRTCLIAV